ncbi:response regulator transcription factor [Effusibacillus dendaii]|uniref:DNA-binding response regulator n=1 Tax=Effusibacillus dendaii TaxID=2743772 RepID=A0A7I8DBA4_9BACL|nr:response regulator transcription factor [Effusibacillus dendaii]BCJ87287.1 DNA-binding response regulator [Effusibacillus dendaii]
MVDAQILIVDDDPSILRLLEIVLTNAGYQVVCSESGEKVPDLIRQVQPSLIILDIELPDFNGIQLVQMIREHTNVPIMMVSGKNSDVEKISSFNSGADDYVVKPFSVAELVARVQAILRRFETAPTSTQPETADTVDPSSFILMESERHRVFIGSKELSLTQKEFQLLQLLLDEKGKVLSRDTILDKIWGINNVEIETRAVDACISRLRKKIKSVTGEDVIEAVPGFGYRLIV